MPDNNKTSDVLLAEIGAVLSSFSKDLASVLSLLYVKSGDDYKSPKNVKPEDWNETVPGQLVNAYLKANPFADKTVEEILEEAENHANPELYELCRIENALTFIYACLSAISAPQIDTGAGKISPDFPTSFSI